MILSKEIVEDFYIKYPVFEFENSAIKCVANPVISVIIITFQQVDFIKSAIEGVLQQKCSKGFEVIICDDDSTDGTREICIEYATKFPQMIRLFLHKRENNIKVLGKPCGIFQYVYSLLQARGNYIAICSGDDFWQDEFKLEKQSDFLLNNPSYSLVYHGWVEAEFDKQSTSYLHESELKKSFPKASTCMHVNFSEEIPSQFLEVIQEDVFSWFILEQKGKFMCLPDIKPTVITVLPESLSRSNTKKEFVLQAINVQEKILEAYTNTSFEIKAKEKFIGTIRGLLNSKKNKSIYYWLLNKSVFLFFKHNLFLTALKKFVS
ncbi:glycosyltransferase family 2 protein [Flavihumibacter sp. CACIAM 22H1]|uniref:glycosyltransferase family 2 protein n=1 Tax=Flavihumibacter sp. CACIAM 22H1 TaxID=1812911 RepID=UPI0007A8B060|nr:glycosyltransferase family 2 protein [Flavihumibacter sp. CACIAM 22H1]KYP15128.1 MAG: hypothetical protein A1D16_12530 [Flavihumibacter sp. CACIAM 22H1]